MAIINSGAAFVVGTSGDDTIYAQNSGETASQIFGGLGNDNYYIDAFYFYDTGSSIAEDIVVEGLNGGTDTVNISLSQYLYNGYAYGSDSYELPDNVENLNSYSYNGGGADFYFYFNGNSLANVINAFSYYSNNLHTIYGYEGNDKLTGGIGDDTLDGGAGNDTMNGGYGDDFYYVDSISDVVTESSFYGGSDYVYSTVNFTLSANIEDLELMGSVNASGTGNALSNTLYGNIGNNKLSGLDGSDDMYGGDGNDTLLGGNGSDDMYGENGNDSLDGGAGNDDMYGGDGNDTLLGGADNDDMYGGTGNDMLRGGDGNDELYGENDNDTLMGGAGNDTMYGGSGINKFDGGAGNDFYADVKATDTVADTGSGGNDTIYATEQLNGDLASGIENLILSGSIVTGRGNALNNYITGNSANNILFGLAGSDYLVGNSGNDVLDGGDGNDVLDGGSGNDLMKGGNGNDIYIMDSTSDAAVEAAASGGTDTIYTTVNIFNGALNAFIENVTMTGNDYIYTYGNALNNVIIANNVGNWMSGLDGNDSLVGGLGEDTIYGGVGNDTLNGGGDEDYMYGGSGNDLYIVDNGSENLGEYGGGIDTVEASVSFTLYNSGRYDIENLKLTGGNSINGYGNALANTMTGNNANNYLYGNQGNDTLIGGLGNDTLNGGVDNDSMTGGQGDDVYFVDSTTDKVVEVANQGADTINSSISLSIASLANVENLTLRTGFSLALDATGNGAANTLFGNEYTNKLDGGAGNDSLDGGSGDDTLIGGAGNDTLVGGGGFDTMRGGAGNDFYYYQNDMATDTIEELAGGGTDTVSKYNMFSGTMDLSTGGLANIENVILTGSGATTIIGNAANNSIVGGLGADSIRGGAGNDTLNGGSGSDTMVGGTGNDFYYYQGDFIATDTIVELAGEGADTISKYNTWGGTLDLSATSLENIENVILTGFATTTVIGNDLNNSITGGSGVNDLRGGLGKDTLIGGNSLDTLDGGAGVDSMSGGGGDDLYFVDNIGDKVIEGLNAGFDQVSTSVSFTLGANIENIYINGSSSATGITVTGNGLANFMSDESVYGNKLIGGAGNDTLMGGFATDILTGGAGSDTFIFNDSGLEKVTDFVVGTDTIQLVLSGLSFNGAADSLTASEFSLATGSAVVTQGNDGDNYLIYQQATGNLYYDSDGSGVLEAVLIANFTTGSSHAVLASTDFFNGVS